jgi:peptidoglycan/LPS O-acetylase OafA/YrhL
LDNRTSNLSGSHIQLIDLLRGLAALMVCYYHLSHNSSYYGNYLQEGNIVREAGNYGWLGVEIFFVISGFIIPYSLFNNRYKLANFLGFLKRRWVRIEPPYIATIFLILLNSKFNGWLWSYPVDINWKQVLAHIVYLPQFLGYGWLNEIFWTLAIEFQFYIFMALAFVGFSHKKLWVKLAFLAAFCLPYMYWTDNRFLTSYSSLFLLGMIAFWFRTDQIHKITYWICLSLLAGYCSFQFPVNNIAIPILAALTSIVIAFVDLKKLYGHFLGSISYSLYLTHGLIGGNFLFFSMYLDWVKENEWVRIIMIGIAILLSVIFAKLFYNMIEKPFQALSKRIKL